MKIVVKSEDVQELKTDDRGRVYLGSEYANKEVEVAVLDVYEDDGDAD